MATKKPKIYPLCGGIDLGMPSLPKQTKKSKSKQGTDKKDKKKK